MGYRDEETMTAEEELAAFEASAYGRASAIRDWALATFPEIGIERPHLAETGSAYLEVTPWFSEEIDEPDNYWGSYKVRVADHGCVYGDGVAYSADGSEGTDAGLCRWLASLAERTRCWNASLDVEWDD